MSFLQMYFSYGRTHALRKAIRDFTQGNETFGEAWERFMILTRKCPHHDIPDHELAQIFYQRWDYQERQLFDISSGGNFLNTRANESLKRMEEFVEDARTGGIKRGVIDVKGMETKVKMERMEREMKQSLLEIIENFKHLLKDAITTIKREANVSKVQVNSTCGMCASNDNLQDQCKAIQTEQVNAFGQHQNNSNWHTGSKMMNYGHNNVHQGVGLQHHQPKMQGQPHVHQNTQFYQNQSLTYQSLQFHHGQPQFQHGQQQFHQNALIPHPGAPNYVNHSFNQNLWEIVKHLQEKERAWEEEKKLLLTHIEMLKSTQGMVMMSEEPREEKHKGKLEESSTKGNFSGQFPTKPHVNPRNLSYNKTQLNACNPFMVLKSANNIVSCQEHDETNRSLNAISCLRNGKMLPNITGKKQKRLEQGEKKIRQQKRMF